MKGPDLLLFLFVVVLPFLGPVAVSDGGLTADDLRQSIRDNLSQFAAAEVTTRISLLTTEEGRQIDIAKTKQEHPDKPDLIASYEGMELEHVSLQSLLADGPHFRE